MEVHQNIDPPRTQRATHANGTSPLRHPVQGQAYHTESGDGQQQSAYDGQHDGVRPLLQVSLAAGRGKRPQILDDPLTRERVQPLRRGPHDLRQLARARSNDVEELVIDELQWLETR